MKCLVTGGAGFIGSCLVERLLRLCHDVTVVDDFSEGKSENITLPSDHLSVHEASILHNIGALFEGVDVVFHLAAYTRPEGSILIPMYSNEVNIKGTLQVLLHMRDKEVRRIVFSSSAVVYGEQPFYPVLETAQLNPMSPYAVQKIAGEAYCRLFSHLYGMEYNILRFFNTYGPTQNPKGEYAAVIGKFMQQIRNGERPTIYGTGEQRRDYVYVGDVADAIVMAGTSACHGETFDVGCGVNYSVNELFEMICEVLGREVTPKYGLARAEPTQTLADVRKIHNVLGWKARVGLRKGLEKWI